MSEVNLEYVALNNSIMHVTRFADQKPQDRPEVHCPLCSKTVTLKLGLIYRHHAAHRAYEDCAIAGDSNGESILHFNCKHYIADELRKTTHILVERKCERCEAMVEHIAAEFDRVEVEQLSESNLKPDIALYKNGKMVTAIEVFVTHSMTTHKANAYEKNGITWIEVAGTLGFYAGDQPWTHDMPMPYRSASFLRSVFLCQKCANSRSSQKNRDIAPFSFVEQFLPPHTCFVCGHQYIYYSTEFGPLCKPCFSTCYKRLGGYYSLCWRDERAIRETAV